MLGILGDSPMFRVLPHFTGATVCRPQSRSTFSALGRASVTSTSNDGTVHSATGAAAATAVIAPLSRAEAALCLMPELVLQHPDALSSHLPILLHVCVVKADSPHPAVHTHALQVLEHVVHAVAAQALVGSSMADKQVAAAELLADLQASASAPLWPAETTSVDAPESETYPAVQRLVVQLCGVLFFEAELAVKWVRAAPPTTGRESSRRTTKRSDGGLCSEHQ